jgi:hypothetical protein
MGRSASGLGALATLEVVGLGRGKGAMAMVIAAVAGRGGGGEEGGAAGKLGFCRSFASGRGKNIF